MSRKNPIGEQNTVTAVQWYVVYTKPRSEELARSELGRKAVDVFMPRIEERYDMVNGGSTRVTPLFPCYLFVRISIPDDYYKVIWTRGVKRLVGNEEGPVPVDGAVVEFLRTKTGQHGVIRPSPVFHRRDRVRVKKGPFEGLTGVIDGSLDSRGRIRVLMSLLGDGSHVTMPCYLLEKCA